MMDNVGYMFGKWEVGSGKKVGGGKGIGNWKKDKRQKTRDKEAKSDQ